MSGKWICQLWWHYWVLQQEPSLGRVHPLTEKSPWNSTNSCITSLQAPFCAVNCLCVVRGRSWYEKQAKSDLSAEEPEGDKSVADLIVPGKLGMTTEEFLSSPVFLYNIPCICGERTKWSELQRYKNFPFIFCYFLHGPQLSFALVQS